MRNHGPPVYPSGNLLARAIKRFGGDDAVVAFLVLVRRLNYPTLNIHSEDSYAGTGSSRQGSAAQGQNHGRDGDGTSDQPASATVRALTCGLAPHYGFRGFFKVTQVCRLICVGLAWAYAQLTSEKDEASIVPTAHLPDLVD